MNDNELDVLLRRAAGRSVPEADLQPIEAVRREFLRRTHEEAAEPPWWSYVLRLAALFAVAALVIAAVIFRNEATDSTTVPVGRLPDWRLIGTIYEPLWTRED